MYRVFESLQMPLEKDTDQKILTTSKNGWILKIVFQLSTSSRATSSICSSFLNTAQKQFQST